MEPGHPSKTEGSPIGESLSRDEMDGCFSWGYTVVLEPNIRVTIGRNPGTVSVFGSKIPG